LELNQILCLEILEIAGGRFCMQGLFLGYTAFRIEDISGRNRPFTALVALSSR
jgi:hypothetical protein